VLARRKAPAVSGDRDGHHRFALFGAPPLGGEPEETFFDISRTRKRAAATNRHVRVLHGVVKDTRDEG
jgi:hypothetical protein